MADRLMLIATNLAEQLYVFHDRLAVMERVLEKKGLVMRDEIEFFVADEAFEAQMKAFREAFVKRIFDQAVACISP